MNKRQKFRYALIQLWQLFQHYCQRYPANALSVALHLALFILLLIFVAPETAKLYRTIVPVNPKPNQPIVQASVVSSQTINRAIAQRLAQIKQQKQAIARQKATALAARQAKEKRLREAKQATILQQKQRARQKALAKKREQARQREALVQKRKHAEKAKQEKLKQQLKQAALNNLNKLQQQQAQQQQAQYAKTVVEKYIGLIQNKITSNWIQPQNVSHQKTMTLRIALDMQGNVMSVEVIKSSGNRAFDRQAILAVQKSSPLPLPQEAELKRQFRLLTLPFTP